MANSGLPHRRREKSGGGPHQLFLTKTFQIFSRDDLTELCEWNSAGNAIIIKKIPEFAKMVLPQYFKHGKFSSFVRQLYAYGFYKSSNRRESHTAFQHPYFLRDRPDLFSRIKLRGSSLKRQRAVEQATEAESAPAVRIVPEAHQSVFAGRIVPEAHQNHSTSLEKIKEELANFSTWKRQLTMQMESLSQSQVEVSQDQNMVRKTLDLRRNVEKELNKKMQMSLQLMDAIYSSTVPSLPSGTSNKEETDRLADRMNPMYSGSASLANQTVSMDQSCSDSSKRAKVEATASHLMALPNGSLQRQPMAPAFAPLAGNMAPSNNGNNNDCCGQSQTPPQSHELIVSQALELIAANASKQQLATASAMPQQQQPQPQQHQATAPVVSPQAPSTFFHPQTVLQANPEPLALRHLQPVDINLIKATEAAQVQAQARVQAHPQMVARPSVPVVVYPAQFWGMRPSVHSQSSSEDSNSLSLQNGGNNPGPPTPEQQPQQTPEHVQQAPANPLAPANTPTDNNGFSRQIDFIQEQLLDLYNTEGSNSAHEWSDAFPL